MDSKAPAPAKRSILGITFSGAVALFFFAVGTAFVIEAPITIYRQEAAWNWPSAQGVILTIHHSIRGGSSVHYDYSVAGRLYESTTGDLPHFNRSRLRAGNKISVRFEPEDPRISVLDPGFPPGSVFEFLFGVFILAWSAIMAGMCISSYRDPANNIWTFGWKRKRQAHGHV